MQIDATCSICSKSDPAYKCPACAKPYCSVLCCKKHKVEAKCTGMADLDDVVLRYISRESLLGPRGYSNDRDLISSSTSSSGDSNIKAEANPSQEDLNRQQIADRDYNFLNLIERRIGVQRNLAHSVIRKQPKFVSSMRRAARGNRRSGNVSSNEHGHGRGRTRGNRAQSISTISYKPPPPPDSSDSASQSDSNEDEDSNKVTVLPP
ncbi:uncharacterized protein V1516DRAFT_684591 [Lipomyces oligophaga]|uniref:uncharacterized protein n=1 Tax=Lipomyces oligophaga TaxID=45792 RepID=UPI0034CF2BF9